MLRRTTAILATTGVLALGFLPQASAQDPALAGYGAGAQATAMQLSLAGQLEAAFSVTGAAVSGDPAEAAANGAALLVTGASDSLTTAQTPGDPASATDCALAEEVPEPVDVAALDLACVVMETTATPTASSDSVEVDLTVTSPEAVNQAIDALAPVLDEVLAGLAPVLDQLPGVEDTLSELVDLVLANVEGGDTLASIELAPTSSDASKIAGRGETQGVIVQLLPDLQVAAADQTIVEVGPLASITIGDAFAEAVYDPATGEVVTAGQAAFIDVDLTGLQALADALLEDIEGLLDPLPEELTGALEAILGPLADGVDTLLEAFDSEIEANVNTTVDQLACGDANPLTPIICFTAGGVQELDAEQAKALGYDFGATTKGIEASVLDLALVSAAGDSPAVGLRVAGTSAAAAATPIAPVAPAPVPEDPATTLPRTGAASGLPMALGLLAVAGLGATLLRRSRTA